MGKSTYAIAMLTLFIVIAGSAYLSWIMKVSMDLDYFNRTMVAGVSLSTYAALGLIVLAAIVVERIFTRYLGRFARRARLAPSVANNLILTSRLLILAAVVILTVRAGGLPSDWIVAFSALGGAAVGFASTKTIGNFIAGLYLIAARPFKVGDYVRIGGVEGIVHEMSINYTKILTLGKNVVSISNLQIMDRDVANFQHEGGDSSGLLCYTFDIAFDHSVSTDKLEKVFDGAFNRWETELPKKPSYMLNRSDAFSRVYVVYLYVRHPKNIFDLRPKISEEIFKLWDRERQRTSQ